MRVCVLRFGSRVERFKKTLVKATPALLQEAWQWVLSLRCDGSRNFLAALREAVENDEERQHKIGASLHVTCSWC